jgi:hypothetical protein
MIYTCERCTQQFERPTKKKGYRYCSQKCANLRQIKITARQLRPYAEKGLRAGYICLQLKVSRATLLRAMLEHGMHRLWASRRYKKCLSQTVGNGSATLPSETVISQSAVSA